MAQDLHLGEKRVKLIIGLLVLGWLALFLVIGPIVALFGSLA